MNARETIAEAFRRGITITVRKGILDCQPTDKIDRDLDEAIKANAGEIAMLLAGRDVADKRQQIIKVLDAREVRGALAELVFRKMGVVSDDPGYYVNLMPCSNTGDIRIEIRANIRPTGESWRA
jgi:hypothetical protein